MFELIYNYWFSNKNIWFNSNANDDITITNLFYQYFNDIQEKNICQNIKDNIVCIIFYDQFPRHVFRNEDSSHIISFFLEKAIILSNDIINNSEQYNKLTHEEWCFVMLPFRHSNIQTDILKVMKEGWLRLDKYKDDLEDKLQVLKNFMRATYERCPLCQSEFIKNIEYKEDGINLTPSLIKPYLLSEMSNYDSNKPLHIPDSGFYIYKHLKSLFSRIENPKHIIISLSGGVDSMLLSFLLKNVATNNPHLKISVVHINYTNRESCDDEVNFLINWCKYLNIQLYVRNIYEIKRVNAMENNLRQTYELYTRNVRFNTYKHVSTLENDDMPIVFLGHNKDDCFENIMTNIAQKTKYNDLNGMSECGIQDNIKFIRPFIDITKEDIYKYANEFNIPFLPTSTPVWSMRGQIRDTVKPALISWHNESINGIFELSSVMKDLYENIELLVDKLLTDAEIYQEPFRLNITFNTKKEIPMYKIFWIEFFNKTLPLNKPSLKSIEMFIENLKRIPQKTNIQYNLTKEIIIKIKILKDQKINVAIYNLKND